MCWNYQGAGHPRFHNIIQEYWKEFSLNILSLLEPRVNGIRADGIIAKMRILNSFRVEANGFARGIWLCWNEEIHVHVLDFHPQVIHSQGIHV